MKIDVKAEALGSGSMDGFGVVTYMRLIDGSRINGHYTAMWLAPNEQVLEHIGEAITVQGIHESGQLCLMTVQP